MTSLEIQPDARKSLSDEEIARRVAHAIAVFMCAYSVEKR
jgi:TetR/AcrR family transcriptional repressor of mexJK operon